MQKIGFIGVGVMGRGMVRNLKKAGFDVAIYTRTKAKVEDLIAEGSTWCDSTAECARGRDAVITIVGYPKDVEEVYFGEGGILQSADAGTCLIDMTTTDPAISLRIYEAAKAAGLHALDAPVSGGDVGAKNGTLSIMAGGDASAFEACLPLFEAMGSAYVLQGGAGAGQHTKMANQIALGGCLAGVCEALAYGQNNGLDVDAMLSTISKGAAGSWQMSNMGPRILKGDFNPGFFVKHYIKDLTIALSQAKGYTPEVTELVFKFYQELEAKGYGDLGTQALMKHYVEE